jgi:transposase
MSHQNMLTLRHADQARADFALIESNLEFIMGQLARMPTRAYLCRMLLLATASIWALLGIVLLVERTFSWFGRNRRLARDFENLAETTGYLSHPRLHPACPQAPC